MPPKHKPEKHRTERWENVNRSFRITDPQQLAVNMFGRRCDYHRRHAGGMRRGDL